MPNVIDIIVKAQDQASKTMETMGNKIKGSVKKLIQLPHIIAAGAITVAIKGIISAYGKQEEAIAKLNAGLKASGKFTQEASDALVRHAGALQQSTTFGDEQIIAAQAMLATFKLSEEQIKKIIPLTLDMAAATGTDAVRAAVLMGKAAVGVTGELSRYGIIVDKTDLKNRGLAAVLDEVRLNFGGTAKAVAKEGIGPLIQFGNLVGDIKERLGAALIPALSAIVAVLKEILPAMEAIFVTFVKYAGDVIMGSLRIAKILTNLPVLLSAVGVAVTVLGKKILMFFKTMTRTNIIIAAGTAALIALEEVSKRLEARIAKTTVQFEKENDALKALNRLTQEGGKIREEALGISKRYAAVSLAIKQAEEGEIEVSKEMIAKWKERAKAIANEALELEARVKKAKEVAENEKKTEEERSDALLKIIAEKKDRVDELTKSEFDFRQQKIEEEFKELTTKYGEQIELTQWRDKEIGVIEEERAEARREKQEEEKEAFEEHLEAIKEIEGANTEERFANLEEAHTKATAKYEKGTAERLKIDETYEKSKAKLRQEATKEQAKLEIEQAKHSLGTLKSVLDQTAGLEGVGKEERKGVALASAMISQALSLVKVWEGAAGFGPFAAVMAAAQTALILAKTGTHISKIQGMQAGGIVTEPTLALIGEAGPEKVTPLEEGGVPMGDTGGGGRGITVNMQILDIEGLSPSRKQEWAETIKPFLNLEEEGREG